MTYRSFAAASLLIAAALYPNLVSAQTMRGASVQMWTNPGFVQPNVNFDRRYAPETAPGGTVVLRGSRAPTGDYAAPEIGITGEGYGSTLPPARILPPGAGR